MKQAGKGHLGNVNTSLQPDPRTCANSLLTAVGFQASPVLRPTVMAREVNSGGSLEPGFTTIVSAQRTTATRRWLPAGIQYSGDQRHTRQAHWHQRAPHCGIVTVLIVIVAACHT